MNESENQFSLTRVAPSTSGRANNHSPITSCYQFGDARRYELVPIEVVDGVLRVPKELSLPPKARLAVILLEEDEPDLAVTPAGATVIPPGTSFEESDSDPAGFIVRPGTSLADVEKMLIRQTLRHVTSNREEAAKALGMSRRALQYKLKEYGILDET